MEYTHKPIGILHSCYRQRFGIPRQAGLVQEASGTLEMIPPYDRDEAFLGLEGFSHLWLLFAFHESVQEDWSPTVRPPRLGGNERMGVFSTRSPFRPNSIGLSAVALEGVERKEGKLLLSLKGVDLLDGTPVIDIKPYVPYADSIPNALGGFAAETPRPSLSVVFTDEAQQECVALEKKGHPRLMALIEETLQYDPRPAYRRDEPDGSEFGMKVFDLNVKWSMTGKQATVFRIEL